MRKKNIIFPRYINRPKLFFIFEYDEVTIFSIIFVVLAIGLALAGAPAILGIIAGLGVGVFIIKLYRVAKNEKNKGYLHHFLYIYDLPNPFGLKMELFNEELRRFSNKNFIPYGFETEFRG